MTKDVSLSDETDLAIGVALRALREEQGMSARNLAFASGVSASMVSRIESGQVSPSISTLNALSRTLNVPLVSLFRETTSDHTDFTHVKSGEGLRSTRIVDDHTHEYVDLAFHIRRELQFEARLVTLHRQKARPPVYVGHGVVFIYALEGEAVYGYGERELTMKAGDSLSLDSELSHGFRKVVSETFSFLTVQAERRR